MLHISVHSGFKLAMLSKMVSANRSDASAWKRASLRRNCRLGCVCSSMYGRCVQSVVGQERDIACVHGCSSDADHQCSSCHLSAASPAGEEYARSAAVSDCL